MRVTITTLRQQLFRLADRALAGDPVEFTYKGVVFRVIPETKTSKLSKLTAQTVLAPNADLDNQTLLNEMQTEWEKDWSEL